MDKDEIVNDRSRDQSPQADDNLTNFTESEEERADEKEGEEEEVKNIVETVPPPALQITSPSTPSPRPGEVDGNDDIDNEAVENSQEEKAQVDDDDDDGDIDGGGSGRSSGQNSAPSTESHTVSATSPAKTLSPEDDKLDEAEEQQLLLGSGFPLRPRMDSFSERQSDYLRQQNDVKDISSVIDELRMKWKKFKDEHEKDTLLMVDTSQQIIEQRLDEVKSMCRHTIRSEYLLASLPQHLQDYVWKLTAISNSDFVHERRSHWRALDYFLYAARMARRLAGICMSHKKLVEKEYQVNATKDELYDRRRANMLMDKQVETTKYSIGKALRLSLWTLPDYRNAKDIKQILWFLHTYDVFIHLFPSEMENRCARLVGYERYDDGRIIAYQGKCPMKNYYVISGKIDLMKHYKLMLGEVNRCVGSITAGMTTDPTLMENNQPLDYFMVSRGLVEVLVLDRWDYLELHKSYASPPIDFIRNISIFREFPCELFLEHQDEIEVKYFQRGRIVAPDSSRLPFLLIVKSGCVKVCRQQMVYNTPKHMLFQGKEPERLGLARPKGRASELLGLPGRQKEWKDRLTLPPIIAQFQSHRSKTMISGRSGSSSQSSSLRLSAILEAQRRRTPPTIVVQSDDYDNDDSPYSDENGSEVYSSYKVNNAMHKISEEDDEVGFEALTTPPLDQSSVRRSSIRELSGGRRGSPLMNVGQRTMSEMDRRGSNKDTRELSRLFLTREKTDFSTILTGNKSAIQQERHTFVQLDAMKKFDVFGFKNLSEFKEDSSMRESWTPEQFALSNNPESLVLISDGAEVIRIRKKFFRENAGNNTMLKVETMSKEYASEEEARNSLDQQEIWRLYRKALIRGVSDLHTKPVSSRVFT